MHNRRRRRNRDITQWIVYGVALAVVILAVVLLFKGCKGGGDALESTEEWASLLWPLPSRFFQEEKSV